MIALMHIACRIILYVCLMINIFGNQIFTIGNIYLQHYANDILLYENVCVKKELTDPLTGKVNSHEKYSN